MSNITLTMPPELLRQAKVLAAQRDTSVSGLVATLLSSAIGLTDDDAVIWEREAAAMEADTMQIGTIDWSRDEVHAR